MTVKHELQAVISCVKESQEEIAGVIHHLEETGEIIIPHSKGDTVS
jgi:flagellar motor switch protein FliG